MSSITRTTAIISAAVDAFNHGQQDALGACHGPGALQPQALLGCAASRTCSARRPIPIIAGESELSLIEIREVGKYRAVCRLAADGTQLVGLYAVRDGCIAAGCHYYSDIDLLTELGILPLTGGPNNPQPRHGAAAVAATAPRPRTSPSLGDSLLDARLAHRQQRLRLAIRALDLRVEALAGDGNPTPQALTAAIRGFQQELEDTQQPQPQRQHPAPRGRQPTTTTDPEHRSPVGVDEVYPGTTLVGSCSGCRRLLFDPEPHDWVNEDNGALCMPYDAGAALYCGACSER
ncbi:MAG TPA: hypothetical protein PKB03_10670 [Baekduia sp.]|nr:hypothetical protein [Baekduia sp.]